MVTVPEQNLEEDVREIKEKISQIQRDITSYITAVHNHDLDLIFQNMQTSFIHALISQLSTEADKLLDQNMIQNCEMHKTCKNNFKQLLTEQTDLLNKKTVTKEDLEEKYNTLEALRKNAPFEQCNVCFNETHNVLDKQSHLIKSLNYQKPQAKPDLPENIPTTDIVNTILEPIAHTRRLEIMKSLYYEPKTFTQLSKITGLKGGNLLFHLQKLTNSEHITQKHERSHYQITKKGQDTLKTLQQLHTNMQK